MKVIDLVLIGPTGNTHLASSFERAARDLGLSVKTIDTASAFSGPAVLRRLSWRLLQRRPPRLSSFQTQIKMSIEGLTVGSVIVLGHSPVTASTLQYLRSRNVCTLNYSTDDPWNSKHKAAWHLRALRVYDRVFTPRRANVNDLTSIGCAHVRVLPFGYDPHLYPRISDSGWIEKQSKQSSNYDLLFVGGGDDDREPIISALANSGLRVKIYGAYWDRYKHLRPFHYGQAFADTLLSETRLTPINLCLVRKANRDGHVMRSFEIPAAGGFALMEDTIDHRSIFGPEGESVIYFSNIESAINKANELLGQHEARQRMAFSSYRRITNGNNTYADRLLQMLTNKDDE